MHWLSAPGYWGSRLVFVRLISLTYVVAFVVAVNQFRGLLGTHGLTPIPSYVRRLRFRRRPSVFVLHYSDRFFASCCWIGALVGLAGLVGLLDLLPWWGWMIAWLVPWVLYVSILNVGQIWYSFGWESLLCEVGFLIVFLGPSPVAPPTLILIALRWLLFRLEFGAGLIKLRGDACWRDLTCLNYHHETQPMPGPLSRHFHLLPPAMHRVETLANHATQLVVVFGLFAPQPAAGICALVIAVTQLYLIVSGNFSWLNLLALSLALSVLPGSWYGFLPGTAPSSLSSPVTFRWLVVVVTVVLLLLSWRPARNLVSRRQVMNTGYDPLHLVNSYGAFGSVTRERHEVILAATRDPSGTDGWCEYGFRGKPGEVTRQPRQIAPYHLRLDWLLWFVSISSSYGTPWLHRLLVTLRDNNSDVVKLLRSAPFEHPEHVRASLYRYRFSTRAEQRETGAVWQRSFVRVLDEV